MFQTNDTRRALGALVALLCVLPAASARAQSTDPGRDGFIAEPKTVPARKYSLAGRSELGFFATVPVPTPLTEHYGAAFNFAYHFSDLLALDVHVGGGYPRTTGLVGDIRQRNFGAEPVSRDDFSNSIGILVHGQLGLRITPVYGKLNLAGELPVHFNLYGVVSAGGGLVKFDSILKCGVALQGSRCPGDQFFSEIYGTPMFGLGIGARFFINDAWSVRIEVRDELLPDHRYLKFNPRSPTATPGTLDGSFSLVQQPLVFLGAGMAL